MSFVDVLDQGGDVLKLFEYHGYRTCRFGRTEEQLKAIIDSIMSFEFRKDDVLICSYPKTGTNWLCEMVTQLLCGEVEYTKFGKGLYMMEYQLPEDLEQLKSPRPLNCHFHFRMLPKQLLQGKTKVILIARNPKDVAVSFYNHTCGIKFYGYNGKWENFLKLYMDGQTDYGSYESYLKEWEQAMKEHPDMPVHVVHYEDLKESCTAELQKIVTFLGLENRESIVHQIAEKCQFSKLKTVMDSRITEERRQTVVKNNFSMLRKGEVGDWKNWFTVAQNEMFDAYWEERMKDSTFKFKHIPTK